MIRLWDREEKKLVQLSVEGQLVFAQFSSDGKALLTATRRGGTDVVQLWDTATVKTRGAPLLASGEILAAAFSPDSKVLAVACGKRDKNLTVAVGADGKMQSTTGDGGEGQAQLWDAVTGRPLGRAFPHHAPVLAVAFNSDGTKLVTGSRDGTACVWDIPSSRTLQPLRQLEHIVTVSADGRRVLVRGESETARLHDVASGLACGEPVAFTNSDHLAALSPDGRKLVIAGKDKMARLLDAVTGKPIGDTWMHLGPVVDIRFRPDGHTIETGALSKAPDTAEPVVYLWNAATGDSLEFERDSNLRNALAFSPDGNWAIRPLGSRALIVGVSGVKGVINSLEHRGPVVGGLFSPDSRTVMTIAMRSGSWEEARLWDVATGQPLGPPLPHQGPVRALAFSADSKLVLTGSDDGTARVWDAATGKPFGPPLVHAGRVRAVAFRSDAKLAATGSEDGTVQLWHVATSQPLGQPLPHPHAISVVSFGAAGDTLIVVGGDTARLWKVPQPTSGDARRLLLRAEAQTGMELDGSSMRLLDDAERARRWRQLDETDKPRPTTSDH